MEMDLRNYGEETLQRLLTFTEKLADRNIADGLADTIDVENVDLEGAEASARKFALARNENKRGKVQADDAESVEIRDGVRSWLKRTNRLPRA